MKPRELIKVLKSLGCVEVRQVGSHIFFRCGACQTTVAMHAGEDIKFGTLKGIERQLEPCFGKGWLTRRRN